MSPYETLKCILYAPHFSFRLLNMPIKYKFIFLSPLSIFIILFMCAVKNKFLTHMDACVCVLFEISWKFVFH